MKMTKTDKRIEAIRSVMESRGIMHGNYVLLSLWELAYDLNNTWKANLFLPLPAELGEVLEDVSSLSTDGTFSVRRLRRRGLPLFFRPIRDAIRRTPFTIDCDTGGNGVEYVKAAAMEIFGGEVK